MGPSDASFSPADDHLELLLEFGLGTVTDGPWFRRLGEAIETPAEMMDRQVGWAASHGFTDRLALLAQHGIDVSGADIVTWRVPDDVDAKPGGRTALHEAAWEGNLERVRALLAAGADPTILDDTQGTTPLGWAEYAYQDEAAAVLRPLTPQEP